MKNLLIGLAAVLHPEWYESGAYSEVRRLMPISWWGVLMLCTTLVLITGAWTSRTVQLNVGLVLVMFINTMFAWSIFTLTWQGATGAFAGSVQWVMSAVVAGWFLFFHPFYVEVDDGQ